MTDYDLLHTLALRLLDPRHRMSPVYPRSYPKGSPSLFVGTLPSELDVDLPIPDEGRILGTVHAGTHSEIALEVALSTKRVLKFYEDRLAATGWTAYHAAGNQWNGFQHHTQPDVAFGVFDQGPRGPALNVVALADAGPTDLFLYLNTEVAPPPTGPYLGEGGPRPRNSCIPGLSAPPGTTVEPQGGEFGPENAESFALIGSEIEMDAITEHYVAQLCDAGWSLDHQEYRDTVTQTIWHFTYRAHQYVATMEFGTRPDGRYTGRIHAEQASSPT